MALRVVVVQERHGIIALHEAPGLAEGAQVLELAVDVEVGRERVGKVELCNLSQRGVHLRCDSLAGPSNHLLEDEQVVLDSVHNAAQLARILMLGSIDANASNADGLHVVNVVCDLRLNPLAGRAQIREPNEVTVLHVPLVLVIGNLAVLAVVAIVVMHVIGGVDRGGPIAIRLSADAGTTARCDVIDHCIGVDANASLVASPDHVRKLRLVARAADEVVSHWLVPGPPLRARDVVVRWRDLHGLEALRAQEFLALLCHVRPFPLEEVNEGRAAARWILGAGMANGRENACQRQAAASMGPALQLHGGAGACERCGGRGGVLCSRHGDCDAIAIAGVGSSRTWGELQRGGVTNGGCLPKKTQACL
mmetsp:Transcript_444/g.1027  ORF Transcript_444/g.1027 Transcript_444/m.1027 type:complete len:365 (+) Transcript_444:663-1757(+)